MKRAAAIVVVLILALLWAAYVWVGPELAQIDRRVDVASKRNYPIHLEQAVLAADFPDLAARQSAVFRGVPLALRLAKHSIHGRPTVVRRLFALTSAFFSGVKHTQREILGAHLETVYLGRSGPRVIIGVEDGATVIAGKPAQRLNLHESALLAGMMRSPANYSPTLNAERTLQRRNAVLSKMLELGMITRREYEAAVRASLR